MIRADHLGIFHKCSLYKRKWGVKEGSLPSFGGGHLRPIDIIIGCIIICIKRMYREMSMSKTTVVIDEKLMQEALRATNLKTKKEVIEKGLRELLRRKNREILRQELGTFDIDLSLEELKKRRAEK
jgi:Arc/MetJ family transcription regulator